MDAKIKSTPQVPGMAVPHSAPDSSMPNHLNLPEPVDVAVVVVAAEEVVFVDVVTVEVARVVEVVVTCRHWLYQAFEYTHVHPAIQVVEPV